MKEENGFYYGVDCKNTTPITLKSFDKTTILGRVGMSFAGISDLHSDSEYSEYICTDPKNELRLNK